MSDSKCARQGAAKSRRAGRTHAPARENTSRPETVAERVAFIADEMADLRWHRKRLAELAALWGLSESTIKNYSAEAHRLVTVDSEECRRDLAVGARKLIREAIEQGDKAGFRQVADVWMTVSGAKAPEEHRVITASSTPAEAARLVREAFGEKALPKLNGSNGHAKANGSGSVPPPAGE